MRLARVPIILCTWALAGILFGQQITALAPDTIFFGGKIVTVDPGFMVLCRPYGATQRLCGQSPEKESSNGSQDPSVFAEDSRG